VVENIIENENVTVKIDREPNCIIKMEVTASPDLVKKARKKAVKTIAKDVDIPGFRKGKAPADILEKKYPEHIDERWQKVIADDAFLAAQKAKHTPVLNNNTQIIFNMKSHSLNDGAEMSFSFETDPVIPTIEAEKFKLKEVKRKKVGKKELDEYLKQVQLMYAEWNEVTDRAVKEKDYVILDIESLEDEDKGAKIFSDTRFEVTKKNMADWMRELVIGQKTGAELEGVSKPDTDASAKEKKEASDKKVKVTIKKIEEPKTMELNDDFARGLNFPSFEELKTYAEKMLNDKADQAKDDQEKQQVNKFLIENHDIDLPKSLVDAEFNHRKKQSLDNPAFKSKYDAMSTEEKKAFEDQLRQESKESVGLFFISRKVCEDAKIPLEYEEVEKEARALMLQAGMAKAEIPQEVKALSLSRILLRKAQEYILETAKNKKA